LSKELFTVLGTSVVLELELLLDHFASAD